MSTDSIRKIILDTETTGLNQMGMPYVGHRIIEIGAVEIVNRRLTGRQFHVYLKPDRLVDLDAFKIHGISDEFLVDKPTFAEVADEFFQFIYGSELVIHNAPFDIGFLDQEIKILNRGIHKIETFCRRVIDSLKIARKLLPGKRRNNLNALCAHYKIDNTQRSLHGALLDANILAEIFLQMTGGQTLIPFIFDGEDGEEAGHHLLQHTRLPLKVIYANRVEISSHERQLDIVQKKSVSGSCIWRQIK